MMGNPGEEEWKILGARAQAEVYHRHLPQLIWEALYGAALNFPAGSWWTASQRTPKNAGLPRLTLSTLVGSTSVMDLAMAPLQRCVAKSTTSTTTANDHR